MNTELTITRNGDLIINGALPEGKYKVIPMGRRKSTIIADIMDRSQDTNKKATLNKLGKRGVKDLLDLTGKSVEEIIHITGIQKGSKQFESLFELFREYNIHYLKKGGFGKNKLRVQSKGKTTIITNFSNVRKGYFVLQPYDVLLDIKWLISETTGELKRALSTLDRRYSHLEELRGRGDEIKNLRGLSPKSQSYEKLVKFLKRKGIVL